jgi:hypothetical protein
VLELFNLNTDFSQSENVASQNPQKVAELKQMFIGEAKKNRDASVAARIVAPRPNITGPTAEDVDGRPRRRAERRTCTGAAISPRACAGAMVPFLSR